MSDERWADATVAAIDIARLAGVGKAAVGNWRRRFADFPEPVAGTASSPLYRLGDVERWLTHHGRAIDVDPADRVWQWLRTETDDLELGALMGHLGAFLVFLHRRPDAWDDVRNLSDEEIGPAVQAAVAATVPELPGCFSDRRDAEWSGALRTIAEVVQQRGAPSMYEFLLDRYLDAHSRRLQTTSTATAEVMARLAHVDGGSVLDPACGTGSILAAAVAAGAASVAGQDVDEAAARVTGARLVLAGGTDVSVAACDSLLSDAYPGRRFSAVLSSPPFGAREWGYDELAGDPRWEHGLPPRGEAELAWVQHCLAHLVPGGTAVITMPAAAASRRSGRRIRGNLLRSGTLRAVIGLPAEGAATQMLWLLRRSRAEESPPTHLLMTAGADLDTVPALCTAFLAAPEAGNTSNSRAVRIIDLLDDEVDLTPARHVATLQGAAGTDHHRMRSELAGLLELMQKDLPELAPVSERRDLPMTTVGDLGKAGVVSISQAPLRTTVDTGDIPVWTVKDVSVGRPPSGRTRSEPGLVMLEPGDVVATALAKEMAVRVVDAPGTALGPRLLAFRVDPERVDPHFLAGFLRVSAASAAARSTSSLSRTDVRRIPVPLLPLEEQRSYGSAFRSLLTFEDALRCSAEAGASFVRSGIEGLATGTLRPGR